MHTHFFAIGKIYKMPETGKVKLYSELDNYMELKVEVPFEIMNEFREYDILPVSLMEAHANIIKDNCHEGSLVSLNGRLMNIKKDPEKDDIPITILRVENFQILDYYILQNTKKKG